MVHLPLVSIGLPVYNGSETIEHAINTLLAQTYSNFEIVISDNASTDGTLKILTKFQTIDSRIKVFVNETNKGSIWNFNKVFKESTGKYFMWASHDDHHEADFVATCVKAMEAHKEAVLCAPNMQMTSQDSEEVIWISDMHSFTDKKSLGARYQETLKNFPAVSIYGMYRLSSLAQTHLFPKVIGGDLLLIQELSLLGEFIGVPDVLFTRRGRANWNSIHQDYMIFFGIPRKPIWYFPFIIVFLAQIRQLLRARISIEEKLQLLTILFRYQLSQLALKVCLKLLKYLLPNRFKLRVGKYMYWKFMNGPNIRMVHPEIFVNRIVKPRLGWFN
jgi:glycosyltransferase involved in cell wall biosynthesis